MDFWFLELWYRLLVLGDTMDVYILKRKDSNAG